VIEVVLPLHPRGRRSLEAAGIEAIEHVRILEPLGYIDFMSLLRGSSLAVTDSGGVQEETTILRIPCLTVRRNTERPITVTHGTNRLVEPEDVESSARAILAGDWSVPFASPPLWDGHAGPRIADVISAWLERS
jgi:UDP-N-acetylglucosamine 2-epimerase (non-hydrolysing)